MERRGGGGRGEEEEVVEGELRVGPQKKSLQVIFVQKQSRAKLLESKGEEEFGLVERRMLVGFHSESESPVPESSPIRRPHSQVFLVVERSGSVQL